MSKTSDLPQVLSLCLTNPADDVRKTVFTELWKYGISFLENYQVSEMIETL